MGKWGLVAIVAVTIFGYWYTGRSARAFAKVADELQHRAPYLVAPGVRIDKAELQDKELAMTITLTDETVDTPRFQQEQTTYLLKKTLTTGWCGHQEIRGAINHGFSMSAVAKRTDGSELTRIRVSREECICAEQGGDVCVIR